MSRRKQALPVRRILQRQGDSGVVVNPPPPEPGNLGSLLENNPLVRGLNLNPQNVPTTYKGPAKRLQEVVATYEKMETEKTKVDEVAYDLENESDLEKYANKSNKFQPAFIHQLKQVAAEIKSVKPEETFKIPDELEEICKAKEKARKEREHEAPKEGEREEEEEEAASPGPPPTKLFRDALLPYDLTTENNFVKPAPVL